VVHEQTGWLQWLIAGDPARAGSLCETNDAGKRNELIRSGTRFGSVFDQFWLQNSGRTVDAEL
jgi:hypothetical protein